MLVPAAMDRTDKIRSAVAAIARVPVGRVADASRIAEDLGIHLVQRVELAALLEVELGTRVPDATVGRARTVQDLVSALVTR